MSFFLVDVTIDNVQIDPGMVATKTTDVDEMQIDSETLAPHITISSVPSGLQVRSLSFFWVL